MVVPISPVLVQLDGNRHCHISSFLLVSIRHPLELLANQLVILALTPREGVGDDGVTSKSCSSKQLHQWAV